VFIRVPTSTDGDATGSGFFIFIHLLEKGLPKIWYLPLDLGQGVPAYFPSKLREVVL
jgi:hypothetical protein